MDIVSSGDLYCRMMLFFFPHKAKYTMLNLHHITWYWIFVGNGTTVRSLPGRENPDMELPLLISRDDCSDAEDEG